jgi:protein arginine kinase activator
MSTCDMCDQEATVHEVLIRNGKRIERHLCERHARELGLMPGQPHASVQNVVQSFVLSKSGAAQQRSSAQLECPACGLTFGEFRKEGLLGCPECYQAFASKLGPLLERAHDGGDHHCGKTPRRAGASLERQARLGALRRELQSAIDHEQYERAASLRDEIATLESHDLAGAGDDDDDVGGEGARSAGEAGEQR